MVNDPLTKAELKPEAQSVEIEKKESNKKKKKRLPCWCWYCDREFKDLQVLIHHQRSRHFKCPYCHKRLHSASGLLVHAAQVHKERSPVERVPNALEGHDGGEWEIYGMRGVPEEDLERWRKGEPMVKREGRRGMTGVGLVSILAAQKQANAPVSYYKLPHNNNINNAHVHNWEEGQLLAANFDPKESIVGTDSSEIPCSNSIDDEATTEAQQQTRIVPTTNVKIVATGKVVRRDKSIFD